VDRTATPLGGDGGRADRAVIASTGTAMAGGVLANGDKLIKQGTLSGNRLRGSYEPMTGVPAIKRSTVS
jgi:hypothetical protein